MMQKPIDNTYKSTVMPEPIVKLKTTALDSSVVQKSEFDRELQDKFKTTLKDVDNFEHKFIEQKCSDDDINVKTQTILQETNGYDKEKSIVYDAGIYSQDLPKEKELVEFDKTIDEDDLLYEDEQPEIVTRTTEIIKTRIETSSSSISDKPKITEIIEKISEPVITETTKKYDDSTPIIIDTISKPSITQTTYTTVISSDDGGSDDKFSTTRTTTTTTIETTQTSGSSKRDSGNYDFVRSHLKEEVMNLVDPDLLDKLAKQKEKIDQQIDEEAEQQFIKEIEQEAVQHRKEDKIGEDINLSAAEVVDSVIHTAATQIDKMKGGKQPVVDDTYFDEVAEKLEEFGDVERIQSGRQKHLKHHLGNLSI